MAGKKKAVGGPKYLTWTTVCFMTVACVASIRNTPSMAMYGWASILMYIIPAILFLIPTALVAAELASGWEGGVYKWVEQGIGPRSGFLAIWNQYALTLTYYPTLLASVAATLAFVISPGLASSGLFTAIVILVVYWIATWVSFKGLKTSAKLSSGGMVIGTLIPGVTLVVLGIIYVLQGAPNQAAGTGLLPPFTGLASIVLIVNNFLSYAGMEVNAIHVNEMENPGKDFPKAMFIASGMAVAIFVLPALAISFVVPAKQLSLTAGVMQAFQQFFNYFHIGFLTPVFAVMIVCAMVGGMMGWLAGPSKGLLMVGREQGYLPPLLQKTNKNGIQSGILIGQGALVSVIALMYAFIPSINSAYWILSAMTTQIYLIMYVLMFIAVIRLRKSQPDHKRGYKVPGLFLVAGVGLVTSIVVFVIGLVPPSQFGSGNPVTYVALLLGGTLLIGIGVPALFLALRKPAWKLGAIPEAAPGTEAPEEAAPVAKAQKAEKPPRKVKAAPEMPGIMHAEWFKWTAAIVIIAIVALAGAVIWREPKVNAEAEKKAQQLYELAIDEGFSLPSEKDAVDGFKLLFGTDGGAAANTADSNIAQAQLADTVDPSTGEINQRPGPIDQRILQFESLVLEVYRPEALPEYQEFLDSLEQQKTIAE